MLPVTSANNVKVYTVSGGLGSRTIPDWIVRKNRKQLRKDLGMIFLFRVLHNSFKLLTKKKINKCHLEFRSRIELIQDFEFPEASNRIKVTRDGNYAIATGTYKPQMRVYDFAEVSMKFERHCDHENVNFEVRKKRRG